MSDQYNIAYCYYEKSIEIAKSSSFYTKHFSMVDNYEMLGYIYIYYNQRILAHCCLNKVFKWLEGTEPVNLVKLKRI